MCQAMNHDLCGTESHDDRTELDRLNYEIDMANLYAEGGYEQSFIPLLCEDCGRVYDDAFFDPLRRLPTGGGGGGGVEDVRTGGSVMDAKLGKPAQVIGLIYKDAMSTTGHSWNRLNGALRTVLSACISAGMRFLETDFSTINNSFRGSFWFAPENWYAEAVNVRNLSACKSLEAFLERPAFMQNGNRLCVGAEVEVPGEKIKAKVTSLQKFALIACTYKADISRSIDKRYTTRSKN